MRSAAGFTLVELLVASAIAMLVAAGAAMLMARGLQENRRLLVEARVTHDLSQAADTIARIARRSPDDEPDVRLRGGAIEVRLGSASWQALTEPTSVVVTDLVVTPRSLAAHVETPCGHPASVRIRSLAIRLAGRSASDPSITRTVRTTVRLRHDVVASPCAPA